MKTKFIIFTSFIFLLTSLNFTSCSQNLPEINNLKTSLVFSYDTLDSLPQVKLSVFSNIKNEARYIQKIQVDCIENEFVWICEPVEIFMDSKENHYAGYTNIVLPKNMRFPLGKYKASFINGLEDKAERYFSIDYNQELYNKNAKALLTYIEDIEVTNKICIFDKDNTVIYYGEKTEEYSDSRKIWNKDNKSAFYKDIYTISNGNVMFIMPLEIIKPGE